MSDETIYEKEQLENSISQALLWLGYSDIEFSQRFDAKLFEEGKVAPEVVCTEISYSKNAGLIPEPIAKNLINLLQGVVDYHLKTRNVKLKIEETRKNLIEQEVN